MEDEFVLVAGGSVENFGKGIKCLSNLVIKNKFVNMYIIQLMCFWEQLHYLILGFPF